MKEMDEQTELLRKILDILTLMAEPQIAQRDEKSRTSLRETAGKNKAKQKAIALMNASRSQSEISQEAKIDRSDLSKLVKALRAVDLLTESEKPQIRISIPANFFDQGESQ